MNSQLLGWIMISFLVGMLVYAVCLYSIEETRRKKKLKDEEEELTSILIILYFQRDVLLDNCEILEGETYIIARDTFLC